MRSLTANSPTSLFVGSRADVTPDRVQELVGQDPPESQPFEFKEKYNTGVMKPIVVMANTYGGLLSGGVQGGSPPGIT